MKYFVIATHWDDNRKAQVKYIAGQFDNYMNASLFKKAYNDYYSAGQFDNYMNASLFKKAYNDYYSADATIVEDFALING